jgi:molecular chaperone GrpE
MEVLKARAETAEQERERFRELALRTRADFENYQKRQQRELAQERLYAHLPLARDLLTALDNLDRAIAEARKAGETGPLSQGVVMVQNQLLDALRRHGITPIEAQGQPFDPNLHEAVMQQPSTEVPPMTVLQVLENGYMIRERVLRPARVIVSVAGS